MVPLRQMSLVLTVSIVVISGGIGVWLVIALGMPGVRGAGPIVEVMQGEPASQHRTFVVVLLMLLVPVLRLAVPPTFVCRCLLVL